MILKAMAAGIVLWLAVLAGLHFYGPDYFTPEWAPQPIGFAGVTLASALLGFIFIRVILRAAPGDEAEAAIGLAFPGMAIGAFAVNSFSLLFPEVDPGLDAVFGALLLTANATLVFCGLFFTRLAPQDEIL